MHVSSKTWFQWFPISIWSVRKSLSTTIFNNQQNLEAKVFAKIRAILLISSSFDASHSSQPFGGPEKAPFSKGPLLTILILFNNFDNNKTFSGIFSHELYYYGCSPLHKGPSSRVSKN